MHYSLKVKKLIQLLLGIGLIYSFIFFLVPLVLQNPTSQKMVEFVEENDIDAGALFYTESEEATAAEFLMRKKDIQ